MVCKTCGKREAHPAVLTGQCILCWCRDTNAQIREMSRKAGLEAEHKDELDKIDRMIQEAEEHENNTADQG